MNTKLILLLVAVAAVLVSAMLCDASRLTSNGNHRAAFVDRSIRVRRIGGPNSCADNITAAIDNVAQGIEAIVKAAFVCPNKNETSDCIALISSVSEDLLAAASDINSAVTACGGQGSACVEALLSVAREVSDAAKRVADMVSQCNSKTVLQCIQDVTEAALDLEELISSIRQAAVDCAKKQ